MIPTNSSNSTNGCDNISSNCVIWQGPDIACIDLCNGDTISEVVSKLATEVCTLITSGVTANPDLTGLDLSCLNIQGVTPTTLVPVLQAMVTQICANSGSSNSGSSFNNTELPIMTLPSCMEYTDSLGNLVTQLRLDLFATLISEQVCTNLSAINTINTTLTSIDSRIVILENCVLPCSGAVVETQVIPTCILPSVLTNVSVLLLALEASFCVLETAVGLPAAIVGAISQTFITNSTAQLTNPGSNYGSIGGWNTTPINLAQSVQNAWVVIDDMYSAIASIQLNCCPAGCDAITFGYSTSNNIDANGALTGITFDFTTSSIPATFNDCAGSTIITITDANGLSSTNQVSVSSLQSNPLGSLFTIGSLLNTNQALTASVAFCVTDGPDTCQDTITTTIPGVIPCVKAITTSAVTGTSATVSFQNTSGITAQYVIDIMNGAVVAASFTVNNPGAIVNHTFNNLTPLTAYTVRVTISLGGGISICPTQPAFTTLDVVNACSAGLDVAIIIDYNDIVGPIVTELQTTIASTISTIDTLAGAAAYRIGLVLSDSGETITPTYATSTEYLALPASQRIITTTTPNQYITAVEMFQTDNGATLTTQLAKINTGAPTAGWPLGGSAIGSSSLQEAISEVVNTNFLNAFTAASAKNLLIYTNNTMTGFPFTSAEISTLNALAIACATAGIRCYVVGAGVNITYTPAGGTQTYPWRDFVNATAGAWNLDYSGTTVNTMLNDGCV